MDLLDRIWKLEHDELKEEEKMELVQELVGKGLKRMLKDCDKLVAELVKNGHIKHKDKRSFYVPVTYGESPSNEAELIAMNGGYKGL